ncbi:hypothetical protein GH742_04395 [Legionella sp. MW5194]|uniref:hypothetical protein n=1 Tax=Legionella sp. MW5194 TaxID=2662448 RepID=UPI00193CF551|nr:hypothetical protein [Legionella sp. MW5194]QRN03165.1 hypothetical protein GH742_04395 [Legionella sp. MW5194]
MISTESGSTDRRIQLAQCGSHWGEDISFGDSDHTGKDEWFETAVPGTIGLNGSEPGPGPGIVLKDIENNPVEMVWTDSLIGCMGLAIIGQDKDGKTDAFFAHARQYDRADAATTPDNPIHLAREFVKSHDNVRVFWGTDFLHGCRTATDYSMAQVARENAQRKLSSDLGCWVRANDCLPSSSMTFLPKEGLLRPGKPLEVMGKLAKEDHLAEKKEFSDSKALKKFTPDTGILGRMEMHLAEIRMQRQCKMRLYHQDAKRDYKILILSQAIEAYRVGNIDVLRRYAQDAERNVGSFVDPKSVDAWHKTSGESVTARLVQDAFADARDKTRSMNATGCGLREDGNDVHDYEEHARIVPSVISRAEM